MSKPYETLPPNYYEKRAKQRVNRPLHYIGRKAVSGLLRLEQQQALAVHAPHSVYDFVETGRPLLVSSVHRSWMDIPSFVEATESVGVHHVRPLSKIENIQKNRLLSWYFHQVGLFAAVRGKEADLEGIDKVFAATAERNGNTLIFPEGTRVKKNIDKVADYARTPAMMAMQHGFAVVHLAMVGGGVGETLPSRHTFRGRHFPVADTPVALFGDVIELEYNPDRKLVLQAGEATREILRPDLQLTLDQAYEYRVSLMTA